MSVYFNTRKVRRLADREGLWLKVPASVVRLLNLHHKDTVYWEVKTPGRGANVQLHPNLRPAKPHTESEADDD